MDDMKTMPSYVPAILAGLMICAGCSVKENREACPCRFMLDYSEVDTSSVKSADLTMRSDDGFVFMDELGLEDFRIGTEVRVPRTEIETLVWSGTDGLFTDHGIFIPLGEDCPRVYFHASVVDADCEMVEEKVVMRKNHCVMTVSLNNMESVPESLNVVGNVCGYMSDGTPAAGEFRYGLRNDDGFGGMVVLPRQTDNSLVLEVTDREGHTRMFNIGEYISDIGYDWLEPDLKDLTLDIDIALTELTLVVQGWDKIYRFNVTI